MISSMCSIPTEILTISGETPAAFNSSGPSWRCVVDAGWQAKDFASPIFTSLKIIWRASINFAPAVSPPLIPKLIIPEARPLVIFDNNHNIYHRQAQHN